MSSHQVQLRQTAKDAVVLVVALVAGVTAFSAGYLTLELIAGTPEDRTVYWSFALLVVTMAVTRWLAPKVMMRGESQSLVGWPKAGLKVPQLRSMFRSAREDEELPPVGAAMLARAGLSARAGVAPIRVELERELFRLSGFGHFAESTAHWRINRLVDELEGGRNLSHQLADTVREFVEMSDRTLRSTLPPSGLTLDDTATVGAALLADLRHRRLVAEALYDFAAHGLWHMHGDIEDSRARRRYFWSAVAASLPLFDYDYEVYREAAEEHNRRDLGGRHSIDVLPLDEFIRVLQFRESELLRLADAWSAPSGSPTFDEANQWHWPAEWGPIAWRGPVVHGALNEVRRQLWETCKALDHYRSRPLKQALRRQEEPADPTGE